MIWKIALYEFRLQRRSLAFWLGFIILTGFLVSEVILPSKEVIAIAQASEPVLYYSNDEIINQTEEFRLSLANENLSLRAGWLFFDRMGLMSTILLSTLSAFVWGRDHRHRMEDLIRSRVVKASQYVPGKFLGLALSYGAQILWLYAVGLCAIWYFAWQGGYPFNPLEFIFPQSCYLLVTILFSIAFLLCLSLVMKNSVGVLLVYFLYWAYCVTKLGAMAIASLAEFLTYWLVRFDESMNIEIHSLLISRSTNLYLNRGLYAGLALLLLIITTWIYKHRRSGRQHES